MSRKFWLYSIECLRLYDKQEKDYNNDHHIVLFCLDEHRKMHAIRVDEYSTFVTLLPVKKDADRFKDFSGLVDDIHERRLKVAEDFAQKRGTPFSPERTPQLVTHVEAYQGVKLVGYTGSEKHWVLKLWLRRESDRYNVINLLKHAVCGDETTKMKIGTMNIEQFVHQKIKPSTEFLHDRGLEIAHWFEASDLFPDTLCGKYFKQNMTVWSCAAKNLTDIGVQTVPQSPMLRLLYIRVDAHSSTATKHNQHNPNFSYKKDVIACIAICTSDSPETSDPRMFLLNVINDQPTKHLRSTANSLVTVHDSEEELLRAFGACVNRLEVHAIVFASDEKCGPTSLIYLTQRANMYERLDLGLSKMTQLTTRVETIQHGKSGERMVIATPGTEQIDICKILPRAMVSPNLDGFTLLDAVRHDNLVPKDIKPRFQDMVNLDYVGTNTFSTPEAVVVDLKLNVQLLRVLEQRCNFVMQQLDIARMCFLDTTSVVERGQQARVGNLFYKWYHKRKIVMNDEQTKKPYLVVVKPRQESSYPRPPWLDNPPPEQMRGEKRPGHVIREAMPPHVQYLLNETHSNTIVAPIDNSAQQQQQQQQPQKRTKIDHETKHDHATVPSEDVARQTIAICDSMADRLLDHAMQSLDISAQVADDTKEDADEKVEYVKWWTGKRKADFARKSRKKIKTQAEKDSAIAYRGGSVLDPVPGYYKEPYEAAMTVDFTSLYPSVMRAYLICYMRVIYDEKYLHDPNLEVEYVPITETHCVVLAKRVRRADGQWYDVETITPEIVADVMQLRDRVKKRMKSFKKGTFEYNVLDSQQLAAKTIANSVYGFSGSRTSQTPCTALAAAITQIGQWMIHTVRFVFLFLGHAALYGDTDSNMIQFWVPPHLTTRDEILQFIVQEGMRVIEIYMRICVQPNNLEPETIKWPFLLLPKKKTYAALQYKVEINSWLQLRDGDFMGEAIKGMAAKKRDKCGFAQDIGCTLVKKFLYSSNVTFPELLAWFEERLSHVPFGKITNITDLNPFIITCSLNADYKQDPKTIKALRLAEMMETTTGARPRVGTRIPYVFTYKPKAKLQSDCVEIPNVFLDNGSLLDVSYILVNQVLNVTKQILSLPIHRQLFAMFENCVQQLVHRWENKQQKTREITQFFNASVAKKALSTFSSGLLA